MKPEHMDSFEEAMQDTACTHIGTVSASDDFIVNDAGNRILEYPLSELLLAWKDTLDGGGPE